MINFSLYIFSLLTIFIDSNYLMNYSIEYGDIELFTELIENCDYKENSVIYSELLIHKILKKNDSRFINLVVDKDWNLYQINSSTKIDSYSFASIEIIKKYFLEEYPFSKSSDKGFAFFYACAHDDLNKLLLLDSLDNYNKIIIEDVIAGLLMAKDAACLDFVINNGIIKDIEKLKLNINAHMDLEYSNSLTVQYIYKIMEKYEFTCCEETFYKLETNVNNLHIAKEYYSTMNIDLDLDKLLSSKLKDFIFWYDTYYDHIFRFDTIETKTLKSKLNFISQLLHYSKNELAFIEEFMVYVIQHDFSDLFFNLIESSIIDIHKGSHRKIISKVLSELQTNSDFANELKCLSTAN